MRWFEETGNSKQEKKMIKRYKPVSQLLLIGIISYGDDWLPYRSSYPYRAVTEEIINHACIESPENKDKRSQAESVWFP